MTETPSDEIKCPICGKPNLKKAANCWYCQSPLDSNEKSVQQGSLLSESIDTHIESKGTSFISSTMKRDENDNVEIPEWLKRIRELKATEEQIEVDKDKWRQQSLFNNKSSQALKPQKKRARDILKKTKKSKAKYQYRPISKKAKQKRTEKETAPQNFNLPNKGEMESQSEDLPDGFVHFSTDKDNSSKKQ